MDVTDHDSFAHNNVPEMQSETSSDTFIDDFDVSPDRPIHEVKSSTYNTTTSADMSVPDEHQSHEFEMTFNPKL